MNIESVLSWFQLFPKTIQYVFYKRKSFSVSKHLNFGAVETLYEEYITLDVLKNQISLNSMNVWDVFGNLGGI